MKPESAPQTLPQGRVSKIIQIHPSLRCNLFCRHCYSSSAPQYKDGLSLSSLLRILEQAYDFGYNVVSISGGEPFLYRPLKDLVSASAQMGYFNSVTTNGMLLRSASAQRIMRYLNLIAVSVDGKESQHDELRGQRGAYLKMMDGVDVIRELIEKFGFIHTVQPRSWELFPWLAELAIEKGAALLHLHPLELVGRAADNFGNTPFPEEDLYKTYIAHYYLQTYYNPQLYIQLDLLHRYHILDNPAFCFHVQGTSCTLGDFASIFRELIINEHGDILPIAHGCSSWFKIGNIEENLSLSQMIDRFMEQRFDDLMKVYETTYNEILADTTKEIFNWSELVINNTHRFTDELVSV